LKRRLLSFSPIYGNFHYFSSNKIHANSNLLRKALQPAVFLLPTLTSR
jgi:hypothetical protein